MVARSLLRAKNLNTSISMKCGWSFKCLDGHCDDNEFWVSSDRFVSAIVAALNKSERIIICNTQLFSNETRFQFNNISRLKTPPSSCQVLSIQILWRAFLEPPPTTMEPPWPIRITHGSHPCQLHAPPNRYTQPTSIDPISQTRHNCDGRRQWIRMPPTMHPFLSQLDSPAWIR